MPRCTGKTDIHNLEPEDLRAISVATAEATGMPLAGQQPAAPAVSSGSRLGAAAHVLRERELEALHGSPHLARGGADQRAISSRP